MAAEEEKRDPNLPGDAAPKGEPIEEAQGSPGDPDIVDETGTVEEGMDAPEANVPEDGGQEEVPVVPLSEFDAVSAERDQYLDALRRLKAEFDNSRKRQERERARILEAASEKLVQELLPVLDNLDRALESEGDIRAGVRATRDQLAEVLANEGLLPVASDGQPFDPNVHEAVMGQPSEEHEEGTVLQTFQRGYLLNGRAIRPAKVVVAKQV
ncbi:nucleotide exchange factor GrpE [Rubrobacter tropicus]|uniref:Protein GrpE n=1 Tax=Rubrobacter tropicus TaxID=2653851 RepID=A0A6G8Q750_9ACTN|nr:nucleotide exchange factor GrpE [Rubrobacter tropicus]QIN82273.1 nucleotide exchange factor GrpE [Rubrobacter tropicus]